MAFARNMNFFMKLLLYSLSFILLWILGGIFTVIFWQLSIVHESRGHDYHTSYTGWLVNNYRVIPYVLMIPWGLSCIISLLYTTKGDDRNNVFWLSYCAFIISELILITLLVWARMSSTMGYIAVLSDYSTSSSEIILQTVAAIIGVIVSVLCVLELYRRLGRNREKN